MKHPETGAKKTHPIFGPTQRPSYRYTRLPLLDFPVLDSWKDEEDDWC